MKIAVAGIGYVGLSLGVLLAQRNQVLMVDVLPGKVDMVNHRKSPVRDKDIEEYLSDKELNLTATMDEQEAYSDADYVIVAVPTNYDNQQNYFDTSAVESVVLSVMKYNSEAVIVIKSTVQMGFMAAVCEKTGCKNILFSPEFLREARALYDNLYPSRIIVGTDMENEYLVEAAHGFAALLQEGALKEDIETLIMGYHEAEAVKLFSNTYLALRVAYFNELDTYAEIKGLDAKQIIRGVCAAPE